MRIILPALLLVFPPVVGLVLASGGESISTMFANPLR